jgi:hypothetical protein
MYDVSNSQKGKAMHEPNVQSRLEAVETRTKVLHRRLKFTTYGWLLTLTVFLISAGTPRPQAAQRPDERTDVVRIRQLVIVDEKGIDRIVIGPIPDPQVAGKRMKRRSPATGIEVNDITGNERVGLAILDDGSTVVGMDDELGQERAHLYYIPKKGAGMLLHGDNEKENISLSIPRGEQSAIPKMEITDQAGNRVAVIPAQK